MPLKPDEIVLLSHGGGGSRTQQLLKEILLPPLANPILDRLDDGACLTIPEQDLVLTTDSYVVRPLFFPGGDIGKLAICGTINDLAMQGAEPRYLSLGLILEEGLPLRDLSRIAQSIGATAKANAVTIVTGDTKVIERGHGTGVFINTTGLGVRRPATDTHVANARPGDAVLLTGTMGDHGIAVLSVREGLAFESQLVSDVAALWPLIRPLLDEGSAVHCLRDPTRGGVAAALNDIARASGTGIRIQESLLPIRPEVRGACNLLGLDPLNIANEGTALVLCKPDDAERFLALLRGHPLGRDAVRIGTVVADPVGKVLLDTVIGGTRIIEVPSGEDLPRIC